MDRRPVEYVMTGSERLDANHVPGLVVRGDDGTCFSFERVEIQYAMDPDRTRTALLDSGPGDGFKDGIVDAYARGVLRDAFGRLTPTDVVLPDRKQVATLEARAELSRRLERHGLEVLELSVSKPKFSSKYEETISRRKVADQDVHKINAERQQLLAAGPAALEQVLGQKQLELQRELEKLRSKIEQVRRQKERSRHEADLSYEGRLQQARLKRAAAIGKADAVRRTVQVQIDQLDSDGRELLMSKEVVLAQLRRGAELELTQLRSAQAEELDSLKRDLLVARHDADEYQRQRSHAARLARERALEQAAVTRQVTELEARGFKAQTEAMAAQGAEAVRAALVEKLAGVHIELIPVRPAQADSTPRPTLR